LRIEEFRLDMKVSSTSSGSAAGGAGSARPAAEGFRLPIPEGGPASRAAVGGASAASGVSGVSALLALQGIGGPEARAKALRKGRRLLDALDRLQVAILGQGPTRRHLQLLQGALAEQREASGDLELDDTLNWAEVRAAVEAAKLEKASQVA
jgi:Class II flagellar assembly regulator